MGKAGKTAWTAPPTLEKASENVMVDLKLNKSFQVEGKECVRRPPNLANPEEQRS
jgi:hypothetical protein